MSTSARMRDYLYTYATQCLRVADKQSQETSKVVDEAIIATELAQLSDEELLMLVWNGDRHKVRA